MNYWLYFKNSFLFLGDDLVSTSYLCRAFQGGRIGIVKEAFRSGIDQDFPVETSAETSVSLSEWSFSIVCSLHHLMCCFALMFRSDLMIHSDFLSTGIWGHGSYLCHNQMTHSALELVFKSQFRRRSARIFSSMRRAALTNLLDSPVSHSF